MADIVEGMKKAALDAVEASKPVSVLFGNVVSVSPLEINLEQKLTLDASQLILTRNVTEHKIQMEVDQWTEDEVAHTHAIQDTYTGAGSSFPTAHKHALKGRKTFLVHNGLAVGDKVILIREQGGQRYVVIDRVGVI